MPGQVRKRIGLNIAGWALDKYNRYINIDYAKLINFSRKKFVALLQLNFVEKKILRQIWSANNRYL